MSAKAIHIRIATALTVVLLATFMTVSAAIDGYRSSLLHDMAVAMKMTDSIEQLSEGTHVARLSYHDRPITIVVEHGRVNHIGYSIFTKEHRESAYSPFFNMVERYALLEKLPMQRIKSVGRELYEEGIHFEIGSLSILPSLYDRPDLEFTLENINGKKYRARWRMNDQDLVVIDTPYTYGLLHGTSMEDDENNLISDLRQLSDSRFEKSDWIVPSEIQEEDFDSIYHQYKPDKDNLFVKPGETYYFDNLNSNRYYTTDNDSLVPLHDPAYPFESMANILTSMEVPNSLVVDANIKCYNYRTDTVSLPLSAMVKYFLDQRCTPFVGLLESNPENTVALLVMRNINEGYCHLIKLTTPASAAGTDEGSVTARINAYIPISKITSLFVEPVESLQVKSEPTTHLKQP